ncbi:MAG: Flp pilus assembly protein CpaB [Thermoclostridium sp.]|nr:Flp pilus assembly protein CpaB [Thermoclostridium sp.]
MRKVNKKALIISILLALASAVFLMQYVRSIDKPAEETPKITIYTAVRSFKTGEEILASDILEKTVDPESVSVIGITDKEQIVGKIVKLPILAGEVFTQERTATREEMQLSWQIPEGKRAINLFVNESILFSDLMQVGDRVDFVATFEVDESIKPFVTTTIQNLEVLAIGTRKTKDNPKEPDITALGKTITLAVTPKEAEKIFYAVMYGQYTLNLRKHGDDNTQSSDGVIVDDFVPAKARQGSGE